MSRPNNQTSHISWKQHDSRVKGRPTSKYYLKMTLNIFADFSSSNKRFIKLQKGMDYPEPEGENLESASVKVNYHFL